MLSICVAVISPASAAGESISITATTYSPGNAGNVGISLSGFDQTQSYQATVKFVNTSTNADVTNGTLTATQGATSLISGYTSYAASKLGFKGTYAAIVAALSSITWSPSAASGNISIRIGISSAPGTDEFYDANSGHYYKYVSQSSDWDSARIDADNSILFGLRGYLAEINSAAENTFISDETSANDIWIGATEDPQTASAYTGLSYDGTYGQRWIWDGAISGTPPVGTGGIAQSNLALFSSWAPGEPNNDSHGGDGFDADDNYYSYNPAQDCAVTNWSGLRGYWNDLPCYYSNGYLIEFGGRPGEVSTAQSATITTTVTAVSAVGINIANIPLTAPVRGATPVTSLTSNGQYSTAITWSGSPIIFAGSTSYTANLTLTPVNGYTLTGVSANFFTVPGATSVTHNANSGVITAVFPATAVAAPAFTISSSSETATVGSAISGYSITSTGGAIASYSISPAISNTPGLTFNAATGLISGSPTTSVDSRAYTITAINNTSTASRTFTISFYPRPTITGPSRITGTVGTAINQVNLSLDGGTDTKTATISPNSSLPAGLTLTSAGRISGTPTVAGTSSTSFTVTDSLNETATATIEFVISAPPPPPPPPPAPVVTKDPDQTSSISSITQGCPTDANAVVIKGSFLASITNIFVNGQVIDSSLWKQSATQVVITINPSDGSALSIQIFNGQVPLLPLQSLTVISRCLVPAPIVTPTPTPTATPKPTPSATATPKPTPTPTNTPQPSVEMVKVGTVYMASGSYSLNDATKKSLIAVAKKINASSAKTILVYGHADNRGGVNNTVLSQNRAKAVANYLRPLLTVKKISIGWYSSNKPVKTGTSAADLAQNRRVEIYTK